MARPSLGWFLLTAPLFMFGNPEGAKVVRGEVSIQSSGSRLDVAVSESAIIEWDRFSIGMGETTAFLQPTAQSSVLNRVVSSTPSEILGTLESNGKVYLVNPNGLFVSKTGHLQTASFIASTFDVLNEDFAQGGDLAFQGHSSASLINEGKIEALSGDVFLIGQFVRNDGELSAKNGYCGIGCGEKVILKADGAERLYIAAPIATELDTPAGIFQRGAIEALSAEIKASGNPYALAISHEGKIDALGVRREGGDVFLVAEKGQVFVSGSVQAKKGDTGGDVHLHGTEIVLAKGSSLDVSGPMGGGAVLAGKDPSFPTNPQSIFASSDSEIRADAMVQGNGGSVILFADERNWFDGSISAKGGYSGGNGGFVEISSPKLMTPRGKVDTYAPMGRIGQLLLDPTAISIVNNGGANVDVSSPNVPGVCPIAMATTYAFDPTPTATVDTSILTSYLACNDVIINSTNGGSAVTGSITVVDPVVWTPMGGVGNPAVTSLSLISDGFVTVNNDITSMGAAATATDTVIFMQAPTVTIDGTAVPVAVSAVTGRILIGDTMMAFPPTTVNMTGTVGSVSLTTTMAASSIEINTVDFNMAGPSVCSIQAAGDVTVIGTGNIDMQSGTGVCSIVASGASSVVSVSAGGFLHLISSDAGTSIINNFGGVNIDVGSDLVMQGGGSSFAYSAIAGISNVGGTGNVTVDASSISMTSGSMDNCFAVIATGDAFAMGGGDAPIFVTCTGAGGLSITSGAMTNSFAGIRTYGTAATNNITLNVTNGGANLTIVSNGMMGALDADAGIRTMNGGNISIPLIGQDLLLSGADPDNLGNIQAGPAGGDVVISVTGATSIAPNGAIIGNIANGLVDLSSEALLITSGALGDASISSDGTIVINLDSGLVMNGNGGNIARIENAPVLIDITADNVLITSTSGTSQILGLGDVSITTTGNILLDGIDFQATIFSQAFGAPNSVSVQAGGSITLQSTMGQAFIASFSGDVDINTAGNLTLTGGSAGTGTTAIAAGAFFPGSLGNLTVNAQDITLTGGSGSASTAFIGTGAPLAMAGGGNGAISVTSNGPNGITITSGSVQNALAGIFSCGPATTNHIDVTLTNPTANLTIISNGGAGVVNAFAGISTGIIQSAAAPLPMLDQGGGNLTIDVAAGNISLSAATIDNPAILRVSNFTGPQAGNLLALAGTSILLGANSLAENLNPTGTLTLVVDNLFPTAPGAGLGIFSLDITAEVNTASGSGLFIYAATNAPTPAGLLNGVLFVPGTFLVDSPTEQWGIYYPDNPNGAAGTPYTFFYKAGFVPPPAPPSTSAEFTPRINNQFTIAFGEAFQNWRTLFDNLLSWQRTIRVGLTGREKWKPRAKSNALSSFDLPDWTYVYYYSPQRNYHTLKLDQRL